MKQSISEKLATLVDRFEEVGHLLSDAEVIADLLRTEGEGSSDLGERLGQSSKQLTHLRHRARKRFSVLFHEQLRQTVLDEEAFEDLCQRLEAYLP